MDPNGEDPISLTAIAIAVAISGVGYTASIALSDEGFNNWDWGQFGQSLAIGAVSGVAAYGIGEAFKTATQLTTGQQLLKSMVHAHVQGSISEVTWGDYLSSAASGFVGGVVSGGIGKATRGWTSEFGRSSVEIGSSMLMGGISAEIAQDGEFWRGAAVAGIVAGANDVAHRLGENRLEKTKKDQDPALAAIALPLGSSISGSLTAASSSVPGIGAGVLALYGANVLERRLSERVFVTYTKTHPDGRVYVGRASGTGSPLDVIRRRDLGHHMNALGFGPAVLDQFVTGFTSVQAGTGFVTTLSAYVVIRGREQQLIDFYGGSMSDGNLKGANLIRGVSKWNPLGRVYHAASSAIFGQIAEYTGF